MTSSAISLQGASKKLCFGSLQLSFKEKPLPVECPGGEGRGWGQPWVSSSSLLCRLWSLAGFLQALVFLLRLLQGLLRALVWRLSLEAVPVRLPLLCCFCCCCCFVSCFSHFFFRGSNFFARRFFRASLFLARRFFANRKTIYINSRSTAPAAVTGK